MTRFLNWITKVREDWRWHNTFPEHQYCVEFDEKGYEVFYRKRVVPVARARWEHIRAIRAYKIDVFSYDVICLGFQIEHDHWIEIGESFLGAVPFIAEVEGRFPLSDPDWYQNVMLPPFVGNDTLLWRRTNDDGIWAQNIYRDLVHLRPG